MRYFKRILAVILSLSIATTSFSGCNYESSSFSQSVTSSPEISFTTITSPHPTDSKEEALSENTYDDISALVYSAVNYDLQDMGFETQPCVAFSSDNEFTSVGIGYHFPDIELFSNPEYASHGFVTVIGPEDLYTAMPVECEYIGIEPTEGTFDNDALYNLVAYSSESIRSDHFISEDQYVIYYQLDSTTVKYETFENKRENYNLSLGSLYDFDNKVFVYDATLFDGYETHSGIELFSEEDYAELEAELKRISEEQEKNGYYVEELNVVYISPESIQAYIDSQEEATFFGYSVADIESSIGIGTALTYTDNGLESVNYFEENASEYNWKSFLTKLGIGGGIILVGAILTPITGGASFGCALFTIVKSTLVASLAEGLGTLAIDSVTGLMQGKSLEQSLKEASGSGLDAFANTFMIAGAITTVGVARGIIKPVSCFTGDTLVATCYNDHILYKPIKDIEVGDIVYSYNEITGIIGSNTVTQVMQSQTNSLVHVTINGELINATEDHPFYCPSTKSWISAGSLAAGTDVLLLDGRTGHIEDIEHENVSDLNVYNLTVENDHTYFVGSNSILVHNDCKNIKNERQNAVRRAWEDEEEKVKNGTSKYNWSPDQINQIKNNGKVAGYEGCHIKDVQFSPSQAGDPNNIIFAEKDVHLNMIHGGNYKNESKWGKFVEINPQFKEQIIAAGGNLAA